MSGIDRHNDPGADSCTRRSAQLLGVLGLMVALVWLAAAAVLVLALLVAAPLAALVCAAVLVGGASVAGVVLSLREASGTCDRIIREVVERDGRSSGEGGAR